MVELTKYERQSFQAFLEKMSDPDYKKDWEFIKTQHSTAAVKRFLTEINYEFGDVFILSTTVNNERLYYINTVGLKSKVGIEIVSIDTMFALPASPTAIAEQLKEGSLIKLSLSELAVVLH